MIYAASPYSSPDKDIQHSRYLETERIVAKLIVEYGAYFISPIVHCHMMAVRHGMPTDAKWWQRYNENLMSRGTSVVFLLIEGWETSKGMKMEYEFAIKKGIDIMCYTEERGMVFHSDELETVFGDKS
jgi:hypothetical protein